MNRFRYAIFFCRLIESFQLIFFNFFFLLLKCLLNRELLSLARLQRALPVPLEQLQSLLPTSGRSFVRNSAGQLDAINLSRSMLRPDLNHPSSSLNVRTSSNAAQSQIMLQRHLQRQFSQCNSASLAATNAYATMPRQPGAGLLLQRANSVPDSVTGTRSSGSRTPAACSSLAEPPPSHTSTSNANYSMGNVRSQAPNVWSDRTISAHNSNACDSSNKP